jgi:hypothetical protein
VLLSKWPVTRDVEHCQVMDTCRCSGFAFSPAGPVFAIVTQRKTGNLVWPPVLLVLVVVLQRLRCQFLLLTLTAGEHQADCAEAPHCE